MKRRLFVLEMKKNIRALPVFFSAMALMALVVFLLVLAGSRMLYRGGSPLSAKIAVVSYEEDSSYIGRLASYLGELSSASAGLEFEIMSEEAARRELKDGEVFAIMLIPDGMMEGILWGNNIPATIILPDKPDLASLVFAELTAAGADLLSAAQSGTYTASYLFSEAGANGSFNVISNLAINGNTVITTKITMQEKKPAPIRYTLLTFLKPLLKIHTQSSTTNAMGINMISHALVDCLKFSLNDLK